MTPHPEPDAAVRADPDYTDAEDDGDEELPERRRSRRREGLPTAYRMRHAPHYVEQLMGDAPLQTVRQIAIDQIDRMGGDGAAPHDLTDLAASIAQVGVLQPLLVIQGAGTLFELLAGGKRLLAARSAGLTTVPCLVVHADDARAAELRVQAAVTSNGHQIPAAEPSAEPLAAALPLDTAPGSALEEVRAALTFLSALEPAAAAARSAFQQAVIADLTRIEKQRAAALIAAAELLTDTAALEPEEFEWLPFADGLRADTEIEARLRGVDVEWLHSLTLRQAIADKKAVTTAWTGILHAILGIATAGDRISISIATPRVRPAILFAVSLRTGSRFSVDLSDPEDGSAFAWGPGELMLRSARHSAQRQGGRLTITTTANGATVEFVAPQPLAYWH
jgi:ParB-like chromosome segregation protein Spo0J